MLQETGRKTAAHRAWRHFLAPLMIPITALIGGCVGDRAPYPDDFPPLAAVESGECPDISGRYSNRVSGDIFSFLIWGDKYGNPLLMADRVVVTQPDPDTIGVVAPLEGGGSMRRSLRRDDNGFSCSNGFVVISTPKDASLESAPGVPVIAFGWDWKELRLAPTIEGSLAVEHVSKGFGVIMVVPVGGAESFWTLIPAVPEAAVKPPSPTP